MPLDALLGGVGIAVATLVHAVHTVALVATANAITLFQHRLLNYRRVPIALLDEPTGVNVEIQLPHQVVPRRGIV